MTNTRPFRSRRLSPWVAAAAAAALTGSLTGGAAAEQKRSAAAFDLDRGNALIEVIYGPYERALRTVTPEGGDATMIADSIIQVELAWFDALAPYHPTAVGLFSNLGRRPRAEQTARNKNIAVIYAAYTALLNSFPRYKAEFRTMMESAGLDPDDRSENTTTPAGIGNLAARKAIDARRGDGSNRDGRMTRKYQPRPYEDYTGYKPVNTAYELRDPSRYQPAIVTTGNGTFKVQQYVTPFWGNVKPISYDSPSRFTLSPPVNSDYRGNPAGYRAQADEILEKSAGLTDRQKMIAEFFNDKLNSLGVVAGTAVFQQFGLDTEKMVHYVTAVDLAISDTSIATWYFKRKYDAVRPISAIRFLYGDKKVTAWGGPGKGTVSDITGNEWQSYLGLHDHPDYPSGTSSFCLAFSQAARRILGTDKIDLNVPAPKGSSLVEPGVTPAADLTLHWSNWTDMTKDCQISRVWGGVHFRAAVENTAQYAPKIGELAYQLVQRKLNGG